MREQARRTVRSSSACCATSTMLRSDEPCLRPPDGFDVGGRRERRSWCQRTESSSSARRWSGQARSTTRGSDLPDRDPELQAGSGTPLLVRNAAVRLHALRAEGLHRRCGEPPAGRGECRCGRLAWRLTVWSSCCPSRSRRRAIDCRHHHRRRHGSDVEKRSMQPRHQNPVISVDRHGPTLDSGRPGSAVALGTVISGAAGAPRARGDGGRRVGGSRWRGVRVARDDGRQRAVVTQRMPVDPAAATTAAPRRGATDGVSGDVEGVELVLWIWAVAPSEHASRPGEG